MNAVISKGSWVLKAIAAIKYVKIIINPLRKMDIELNFIIFP